jgi:cytochrome P450
VTNAQRRGDAPVYEVDFSDPDINRDPWPHLEEMRQLAPVVWNPPSSSWIMTSFDDVRAVITNADDFRQPSELFTDALGDPSVVATDNPRHNELRSIWGPFVSRPAIAERAALIGQVTDRHLAPIVEAMRSGTSVDVVKHLRLVPIQVIATMIGVPDADLDIFAQWGMDIVYQFDAYSAPTSPEAVQLRETAAVATKALNDYCSEMLAQRERDKTTDDLLGVMANTEVTMTNIEKIAYITMFIEGGQDTTTKFVTSSLAALEQHPDQRRALAQNRDLMSQTLEEVMRWTGPVLMDVRLARDDVEFRGIKMSKDDNIFPALGAANRDAARWDNPAAFDIFRDSKSHLGFGFGVHNCMGINMARLVAATITNKLLDAVPDYAVNAPDGLDYGRSFLMRGPNSLSLSM